LEETPATWDLWFSKDDFICVCADLFDPDVPRFKCPLGQVSSRLHDMCGLSARCYAKFQEFDIVGYQQHCSAKGDETHLALGFVAKLSYRKVQYARLSCKTSDMIDDMKMFGSIVCVPESLQKTIMNFKLSELLQEQIHNVDHRSKDYLAERYNMIMDKIVAPLCSEQEKRWRHSYFGFPSCALVALYHMFGESLKNNKLRGMSKPMSKTLYQTFNTTNFTVTRGADVNVHISELGGKLISATEELIGNRFKKDLISIGAMREDQEIVWNLTFMMSEETELQDPHIDFDWSSVDKNSKKRRVGGNFEHVIPYIAILPLTLSGCLIEIWNIDELDWSADLSDDGKKSGVLFSYHME